MPRRESNFEDLGIKLNEHEDRLADEIGELIARIEEGRRLTLSATEQVELPVDAASAWQFVSDPRKLPGLAAGVTIDLLPDGYRLGVSGGSNLTARIEHSVAGVGIVYVLTSASLFGLKIPSPEWEVSWTFIHEDQDRGRVLVEFGHGYRFKNRLAQQAGRALVPLQQKFLRQLGEIAVQRLAPAYVGGDEITLPRMGSGGEAQALSRADAKLLRDIKLRGHQVAYLTASIAAHSRHLMVQDVGRAGMKLTQWHADKTLQNRLKQIAESESWGQALGAVGAIIETRLAQPIDPQVLDLLIACCRTAGLRERDDLVAGIGVAYQGYLVGQIERENSLTEMTRRLRKLAKGLQTLDGPRESRLARGAIAVAEGKPIGGAVATTDDLGGFSSYVRTLLMETSGMMVDLSADVPNARSQRVKRKTELLWKMGLVIEALTKDRAVPVP